MAVKNLFVFDAIVLLAFGIPLIIDPHILASLIFTDATLTEGVVVAFRGYGIFLSATAIALYYGRNAQPSSLRKGLVIFIAVAATLIAVNNIYAIEKGFENSFGWGVVVPTAILSVWSIMLLLREK
jgi:hypothetical protein